MNCANAQGRQAGEKAFFIQRKWKYRTPSMSREGKRVLVSGFCLGVYISNLTELSVFYAVHRFEQSLKVAYVSKFGVLLPHSPDPDSQEVLATSILFLPFCKHPFFILSRVPCPALTRQGLPPVFSLSQYNHEN